MIPSPTPATPFSSRSAPPVKIPICLLNCKPSRMKGPIPCGTYDIRLRINGPLLYHARNPIYKELPEQPKTANKVAGRRSFITEVCAWGLLEWALYPLPNLGRVEIDLLKQNATNGAGDPLRDQYLEKLERLELDYQQKGSNHPSEYDRLKRQTVADMLHIFQGSN